MNAIRQAQSAYGQENRSIRTARGMEYDAVARITHRLKSAAARQPFSMAELAGAVADNRRLWTLFATQVADNDNPLPRQLRAQVLYLAEFTAQHSRKVLNRQADVGAMIDVNTAVMRGLRDGGGTK